MSGTLFGGRKARLVSVASTRGSVRGLRRLALGAVVTFATLAGAEDKFTFDTVRQRARELSAKPYVAPSVDALPEWLQRLNYDEHRLIEFKAEHSLWLQERLPFQVQFFHPGYLFREPVQLSVVSNGRAEPLPFTPELFNYRSLKIGSVPPTLGFAGFKLLYDLNRPHDELGAFLGASYFRLLGEKAHYGLSARGLAIDTGQIPGPEEFPRFSAFWLVKPEPGATTLTLYALLDSESLAGAYRFVITPGPATVAHVTAVVYARKNPRVLGIAPLTSMFWRGENASSRGEDFRPEVHDSDGLSIHTGRGEWLWRPLRNPKEIGTVAFTDRNPRGFGLLQRDRTFDHYNDLEAHYHLRPNAWVEPVGRWGEGTVRLVEIPTRDEYLDNIVAFWTPAKLPRPGHPIEFEYRLHWSLERDAGPAGIATATYHHRAGDEERFLIDFAGADLNARPDDAAPEAVVQTSAGAITHTGVQRNPHDRSWRVAFTVRPDASGKPADLRCFLRSGRHALTETWTYLWQP